MVSKVEMFQSHTSPHLSSSRSVAHKPANQSHMTTAKMSDPRFTLAHHRDSSSSVVRAPDQITEGRGFKSHLELGLFPSFQCVQFQ